LKLACTICHSGAERAERAGFPAPGLCKGCHASMEIASIPTERVYKLADFVIFSHARHVNTKIDCVRCHGPVQERDRLTREVDHSMKACLDCHRQSKATVACQACHELGQ
jgi:hypothetical protein